MCPQPATRRRHHAVWILVAIAVLLAMMWGETWAIEHSAEFVLWFQPAQSGSALGQECITNAIPIAMLH